MPKRAERRHHEERIKDKFKRVAKRWAGTVDAWTNKVKVKWENGKIIAREHYIDWSGGVERMKFIEKTANKLAHHNKCDCGMCNPPKVFRKQQRRKERVLDKTYIEEGKREKDE